MTYEELSEAQVRRSRQFAEAQTDAMSVYCDAEHDLKELQAENAKLREQGERLFDKTLELGTENAKLREYARKLLTGYECGRGELCEGCSWNGWDGDCNARMKARELGIEVES